jgi:hypothetical protein
MAQWAFKDGYALTSCPALHALFISKKMKPFPLTYYEINKYKIIF